MKKFLKILSAGLLVISLGLFVHIKTLQGEVISKAEERVQREVEGALLQITNVEKNLEQKPQLKSKLQDAKQRLLNLQKQAQDASSLEELQRVAHIFRHEDTTAEISKLSSLANLIELTSELREKIILFRTRYVDRKTTAPLLKLEKLTSMLAGLARENNYDAALDTLEKIRTALQEFSAALVGVKLPKRGEQVFQEMKWNINIKMPYREQIQSAQQNNAAHTPVPSGSQAITASQHARVLVCMMRWTTQDPLVDQALAAHVMQQVIDYYDEVSYAQTSLEIIYAGNTPWNGPRPTTLQGDIAAAVSVCEPQVDLRTIDNMVIFPSAYHGGSGYYELDVSTTQWGTLKMAITRTSPYSWTNLQTGLMEHEIGHSQFALNHANFLSCPGTSFASTGCTHYEYANIFDVMGSNMNSRGHIGGWGKAIAGPWVNVTTVTEDGSYPLVALEQATQKDPQLLRIPLENNAVCIEHRKPIGLDRSLEESVLTYPGLWPRGMPANGCLLVELCSLTNGNYQRSLLDMTPGSTLPYIYWPDVDSDDACLTENTNFYSPELGISKMAYTSTQGNAIQVNVQLDKSKIRPYPDLHSFGIGYECTPKPEITIYVNNISELDVTRPFTVEWYGTRQNGIESLMGSHVFTSVPPGRVDISYSTGLAPGWSERTLQRLRVKVDANNEIDELDENNNEATLGQRVGDFFCSN